MDPTIDASQPDNPPPAPPAPEPNAPAPNVAASQSFDIGTYTSGQTNITGVVNQYFHDPADTRSFSADTMAAPLTKKSADEIESMVVIEEAWTHVVLQHLQNRRVVLLTGDRGTGKSCIAKFLAIKMGGLHDGLHDPMIVQPLDRRIRILPRKTADERETFGDRVAVFTDVFEKKNNDLTMFFTADRTAWDHLTTTLQQNNAYWIFTTTSHDLEPIRARLSESVPCHQLPLPGADRLAEMIEKKLRWHASRAASRSVRIDQLRAQRERLVRELRTIPRVSAFIDDYVGHDITFDQALERFDKAPLWFAGELATDVDAWCFALTLTLTKATPDSDAVAWSDFERLRRAITDRIKSDTEIFPRRRARGGESADDGFEHGSGASLTDDSLLERCQAVIQKDVYGLRDIADFKEPARAAELWETLLRHNRRVLSAIVPLLRKFAETESESISLRILAAQILGRIGTIDPGAISLPLIRREWVESKAGVILSSLVGRVIQGALASGSEKYQQAALRALEDLAAVDPKDLYANSRNRLVTAIAAYSQLGEYAEAAAMERLGDIAIEHCAPSMAVIQMIFMLAEKADRDRATTSSSRKAARLRARGRGLSRRADGLMEQQEPILAAIREALVYLAVMNDAVQTLGATRDWIARGSPATGMVMTVLFFYEGGIADRLESFAVDVATDHGTAKIGPLLLSAASGSESIRTLSAFLADLHGSINSTFSMPADVQRNFRERFDECLATWARGAVAAPLFREVVEELFATLAAVRAGAMRRDIFELLEKPAFSEDRAMSAFAMSVRKRIA